MIRWNFRWGNFDKALESTLDVGISLKILLEMWKFLDYFQSSDFAAQSSFLSSWIFDIVLKLHKIEYAEKLLCEKSIFRCRVPEIV